MRTFNEGDAADNTEAMDGSQGRTNIHGPPSQPTLCLVPGLPAITRRLAEKIRANKYIDFTELPPAKGKGKPVSHALEGQVIVVQAADLIQSRRIIPDLATWMQCFALYAAVLAVQQPERLPYLMAYQSLIARASLKYKWLSWLVYDQNFRQEAAENHSQLWAMVDPRLYAQCFTSQEVSSKNWCGKCHSIDNQTANCPFSSRKRIDMSHRAHGLTILSSRAGN